MFACRPQIRDDVFSTLAGIGFRADYDEVDIDELHNAEMLSISAFYKF